LRTFIDCTYDIRKRCSYFIRGRIDRNSNCFEPSALSVKGMIEVLIFEIAFKGYFVYSQRRKTYIWNSVHMSNPLTYAILMGQINWHAVVGTGTEKDKIGA